MVAIKIEVRKRIEAHLASTEMQRVPSLVEEKYLGAAIWVSRPTESALNILVTISSSCQFSHMHRVVMGLGLVGSLKVWVSTLGSRSQDGGAVSGKNAWVAGRSCGSTTPDASLGAARLAAPRPRP